MIITWPEYPLFLHLLQLKQNVKPGFREVCHGDLDERFFVVFWRTTKHFVDSISYISSLFVAKVKPEIQKKNRNPKIKKSRNPEIQKFRFFWKIQKGLKNSVVWTPADLR